MKKLLLLANICLISYVHSYAMEKESTKDDEKTTWASEQIYNDGDFIIRHEGQGLSNLNGLSADETNCHPVKGYKSLIAQRDELFKRYKDEGKSCAKLNLIFNSAKTIAYLLFMKTDPDNKNTDLYNTTHLAISRKQESTQWNPFSKYTFENEWPNYVSSIINPDDLEEDSTFVIQMKNCMCYLYKVVKKLENGQQKIQEIFRGEYKSSLNDSLSNFYNELQIKLIDKSIERKNLLPGNLAFKLLEFLNKEKKNSIGNGDDLRKIYKHNMQKLNFDARNTQVSFSYFDANGPCSNWKQRIVVSYRPNVWNYCNWTAFNKLMYDGGWCNLYSRYTRFSIILLNEEEDNNKGKKTTIIYGEFDIDNDGQTAHVTLIPSANWEDYKNQKNYKQPAKKGWFY